MTQLRDHDWQYSFTSSQDNLLKGFYRPALQEAIRYWRQKTVRAMGRSG